MNLVKPVSYAMFNNRHWVFEQDPALTSTAKSFQDWLAPREFDFIRHKDWPFSSLEISPLDTNVWHYLEEKT